MRWAEISLTVPPASLEPVSAALMEAGCCGVAIEDPNAVSSDPFAEWIVEDNETARRVPQACSIKGYLPVDDRLEPALRDLRERLDVVEECGLRVGRMSLRTVDDESWADAWKVYFKPIRVGRRFVVKPTWDAWTPTGDDLVIEIDPGMAFGSGTHETTRLCLQLLERRVQPGERILDWGAGSGILSLGAALLGASEILAIDLDPVAVRAAAENAERSGLGEHIRAQAGSIESVPNEPPFDRVVANIVATPIIAGACEIYSHLRSGGEAIVSGIVDQRENEVIAALTAAGLELLETLAEDDWRAFLLRRAE